MTRESLSKREQQIIDVIFTLKRATARDVHERLPDAPGYSAVRALLAVMLRKDLISHEQDGQTYVYSAKQSPEKAGKRALSHLVEVFFGGSRTRALASLLEDEKLDAAEIARIETLISRAKMDGR